MTTYLTDDTDLGAVADAIRAKAGTAQSLAFPQGFVSAISALPGLRYAVIDFTVSKTEAKRTFTHNLGTQNIGFFMYPTGTVTPQNYYYVWFAEFIHLPGLLSSAQVLDFSQYNAAKFPEPVTVDLKTDENLRLCNGMCAPYTTQSQWYQGNFKPQEQKGLTFTDNTVTYGQYIANGSYRAVIVDLSPLAAALS